MPRANFRFLAVAPLLALAPAGARGAESVIRGGPARVALVELFSSEGCSSCPPADDWLGSLKGRAGLWKEFVPAAFHVDYWDSIGWKDRFASPEYSARQRRYAALMGTGAVYTPGFTVDGHEWRRKEDFPPSDGAPGILTVTSSGTRRHQIRFVPREASPARVWRAHAALLGFGLESRVDAGENAGRTLRHDFIVLDYRERDLRDGRASISLSPRVPDRPRRYAIAAWVSRDDDPEPVQAAGGYLPER